jgi:hypothetical protein
MSICSNLWNKAWGHLSLREEYADHEISNKELLKEAQQKLAEARNLFAIVDDPEMIDYAIFNLKAAEKRYNYLLKIVKKDRSEEKV